MMSSAEKIHRFEDGQMNLDEIVAFIQPMIDSGLVWKLQGFYGRTAFELIEQGLCTIPD